MDFRKKIILLSAIFCGLSCIPDLRGQRIQFRTPQEAVRYYEDLVGNLTRQVRNMQDENALTVSALRDLQKKCARLESDQANLLREVQNLRRQISADAESRRTQFNALADKLMKQSASPVESPRKTPRNPVQKTAGSTNSREEEEFIEHTVEAGNTLSALARAYKVSVKDIEKVNKIKKGRIFAGQKLLIPVSKKK